MIHRIIGLSQNGYILSIWFDHLNESFDASDIRLGVKVQIALWFQRRREGSVSTNFGKKLFPVQGCVPPKAEVEGSLRAPRPNGCLAVSRFRVVLNQKRNRRRGGSIDAGVVKWQQVAPPKDSEIAIGASLPQGRGEELVDEPNDTKTATHGARNVKGQLRLVGGVCNGCQIEGHPEAGQDVAVTQQGKDPFVLPYPVDVFDIESGGLKCGYELPSTPADGLRMKGGT